MPQPTTAEVRLDEHKAASFGPAGPSILPFWLSTRRLRSNFVAADPAGTEDRDQQLRYPGNVGLYSTEELRRMQEVMLMIAHRQGLLPEEEGEELAG
jgi:hypothetical protein